MKKVLQSLMLLLGSLVIPAAAYAQQSATCGDVNGDGAVNITDVNYVIHMILAGTFDSDGDVNGDGAVNISDINAILDIILGDEVPVTEEHEYVDLGLPSGTLWATCNIGANSPEEYGDYFAWGEIEPKDYYMWDNYKWCEGTMNSLTKYCTSSNYGKVDGIRVMALEDDAACMNWGPAWRIPTSYQLRELCRMCNWEKTEMNGVVGFLITGLNGNSIFLPAAGEFTYDAPGQGFAAAYWTCVLSSDESYYAEYFYASSPYVYNNVRYFTGRNVGCTVRAVHIPAADNQSLYIAQQRLDMGGAYVGTTCTGKLTIINNAKTPKTLTVTTDEPFSFKEGEGSVTSKTVVVPGNSIALVQVMFTASTPGEFYGNVTFKNPELDGGQSVIPISVLAISNVEPGQEYVDLGLPSGTLWATRNIGADSPEQFGDYFAWGETETKEKYAWSTYKWCDGSYSSLTKYCTDSRYGTVDNKTELEPEDDAAWVNLGPMWRMPSIDQIRELYNNCSSRWIKLNGINGCIVTGPNGNSMFMPAAGNVMGTSVEYGSMSGSYWSRTLNIPTNPNGPTYSYKMTLYDTGLGSIHMTREEGYSVRAVRASLNDAYIDQQSLDLGIGLIGETSTGELTIINCTSEAINVMASVGEPFSLKRGEESCSSLTVEVPGNSCARVTVMLTPSTPGEYDGKVIFKHPALAGGQSVVPVHARAYADPEQDYVDLGLPSGTLWAARNVGAGSPEEPGDYFAWGETETKDKYNMSTYKWYNDLEEKLTKYCTNSEYGVVDNKTELDPEDDAAWKNWGPMWRIPSIEQLNELRNECSWTWITKNGMNGYLVTGPNGNTIFMPNAGSSYQYPSLAEYCYYWSRTLNSANEQTKALTLEFTSQWLSTSEGYRDDGYPVRAVCVSLNHFYIEQQSLDLGIVNIGKTSTGMMTIVNCVNEPITLTATIDEPFMFKRGQSTASSITIDIPGKSYVKVAVLFTATTPGQFNGNVTLRSALDGSQSVAHVSAIVFPDVDPQQDAVDLGLPSGTRWATCNVGANSPEELGDYFAWGETEPKDDYYDWSTYKWCDGSYSTLTKYCTIGEYGTVDNKIELDPEDDAAWVNWGPMWRMPSTEQFQELADYCSWQITKKDGVDGRLITGPNGNSIFIPAIEDIDYWSRTLNPGVPFYAYGRDFGQYDEVWWLMWSPRISGCCIRPVQAPQN